MQNFTDEERILIINISNNSTSLQKKYDSKFLRLYNNLIILNKLSQNEKFSLNYNTGQKGLNGSKLSEELNKKCKFWLRTAKEINYSIIEFVYEWDVYNNCLK